MASTVEIAGQDWVRIREGELRTLDVVTVYDVFSRFSLPPGLLTCDLERALRGDIEGLPAPIALVYRELLRVAVNELGIGVGELRVECWSNRTWEARREVEYHVDNDEVLRRRTGEVIMPDRGLIFYTGPDKEDVGGTYFNPPIKDTVDDNKLFCNPLFDDVANDTGRSVSFLPGRLILFDGAMPSLRRAIREIGKPACDDPSQFFGNERRTPRAQGSYAGNPSRPPRAQ